MKTIATLKELKLIEAYDEKEKNNQLNYWQNEVLAKIDPTLEVINATTDLVE